MFVTFDSSLSGSLCIVDADPLPEMRFSIIFSNFFLEHSFSFLSVSPSKHMNFVLRKFDSSFLFLDHDFGIIF